MLTLSISGYIIGLAILHGLISYLHVEVIALRIASPPLCVPLWRLKEGLCWTGSSISADPYDSDPVPGLCYLWLLALPHTCTLTQTLRAQRHCHVDS